MTKKENSKIPEHLRHIDFKPWHFYSMKNKKTGQMIYTLNDNFTDEMMQKLGLTHTASIEVHKYGESGILVLASVIVYETGNEKRQTPGFASVTRMPRDDGQTHFAQLATTRALSTALQRHIGISSHDVEMIVEELGIKPEVMQTREYSGSSTTEPTEAPIVDDVNLDLEL